MLCLEKVAVNVKQEPAQSAEHYGRDVELVKRRTGLATLYHALPAYGSTAYWETIEASAEEILPLEVLVRCVRDAKERRDDSGSKRIFEVIFRRIHSANEYWANHMLKTLNLQAGEQYTLMNDLYADLCECLMRALMDSTRLFWEENFQHCLSFERRHVFRTFMTREGRWNGPHANKTERIPRLLLHSLDHPVQQLEEDVYEIPIEDEMAQKALLAVEHSDLPRLILTLPDKLKAVVLLIFWEGRTEKDTAVVLGITARYVEEVRSGHQPDISDYLARYPLYADEIADFVAYYHAFEVNLPEETRNMPVLSGQFQGAIETAWERVVPSQAHLTSTFTSLLRTASSLHLSISQLAEKLSVSVDILMQLECHAINAATIPRALIKQLADVLQQPSTVIQAFFGIPKGQQVAEAQAMYQLDGQAQSFRKTLEESAQLSEEQRHSWYTILDQEDL